MKKHFPLTLILFFAFTWNAYSLERFEVITTEEMEKLLKDRQNGTMDFLLVNSLDEMIFRNSSIPGSINVPLGQIKKHTHKLGNDLDKLIVPY